MRCGYGSGLLVWCDEAWAGLGVAARFNGPDMECRGELHYMEVRHAGDTPLEGLAWRKSPIAEW